MQWLGSTAMTGDMLGCAGLRVSDAAVIAAGGEVYIEHGYLYDLNDLESHESGAAFLSQVQGIGDNELVNSRALYHSPAEVIEGRIHCPTADPCEHMQTRHHMLHLLSVISAYKRLRKCAGIKVLKMKVKACHLLKCRSRDRFKIAEKAILETGEFWLFGDRLAADQAREAMAPGSLVFYTTRYWNRRTGKATLIPAGGRGKAGLSRQ